MTRSIITTGTVIVFSMMLSFYSLNYGDTTNLFPVDGDVGIGTLTPSGKLEISGNNAANFTGLCITGTKEKKYYPYGSVFESVKFRSTYTGQTQPWDVARFTWGYSLLYANNGAKFGIDIVNNAGVFKNSVNIDGAGNVVIGSGSTGMLLSVCGDINAGYKFSSVGDKVRVNLGDNFNYIGADYGIGLVLGTPNSTPVVVQAGKLGVGTTSPNSKLHVVSGQSIDANNLLTGATAIFGTTLGIRERGNSNGISGSPYTSQIYQGSTAGGNLEIYNVAANYGLIFGTQTTERMRITNGGNVGIGVSSPDSKLQVDGGGGSSVVLSISRDVRANRGGIVQVIPAYDAGAQGNIITTNYWGDPNQGTLTLNAYGQTNQLVIHKGGNAGIGTPAPKEKLHVNGNVRVGGGNAPYINLAADGCGCAWWNIQNDNGIMKFRTGEGPTDAPAMTLNASGLLQAKEIKVVAQPADFVFGKDYKLMPLNDVEQFIKENKHLPDVPSGKVVEKEGYKVGEMQSKLLQKVEELTLYVIELKKENIQLKKRIEQVESKN